MYFERSFIVIFCINRQNYSKNLIFKYKNAVGQFKAKGLKSSLCDMCYEYFYLHQFFDLSKSCRLIKSTVQISKENFEINCRYKFLYIRKYFYFKANCSVKLKFEIPILERNIRKKSQVLKTINNKRLRMIYLTIGMYLGNMNTKL